MALQITQVRGTFTVNGDLNVPNLGILDRHISAFLYPQKKIVLNLAQVGRMDPSVIFTLTHLRAKASRLKSSFSIVGIMDPYLRTIINNYETLKDGSHGHAH